MNQPARIAVLGLGEAGTEIARDLAAAGADVRAYDPAVSAPLGVENRASDADAVSDAELVLSLTTASQALDALENSLTHLPPGSLWADLNTASPGLKRDLATRAAGQDVQFADVALMATVPGRGLATPMLACGPGAVRLAAQLGQYGATVAVLNGATGDAAARKLLRSVFYKGLAAAVIEALAGARAAGCEPWLRDNIAHELDRFDLATIDRLVDGSHRHAHRRADEMAAAEQQLRELGLAPRVTAATGQTLRALAQAKGPASRCEISPQPTGKTPT